MPPVDLRKYKKEEEEEELKVPSYREIIDDAAKYDLITNSTADMTYACCGVCVKKSLIPACKRAWNYPPFRVTASVFSILVGFLAICAILSNSWLAENKTMSYQFITEDGTGAEVAISNKPIADKAPPQARDVNASPEDSIVPPSRECKAPVVIRGRGDDGYEYLEYTHTASHKWTPNAVRTDVRPANVTVVFVSGVTDSDPQRVFRCDECVNSVPEWIAHRYANQPVQTVAIRTWKRNNSTSSSDSLPFAVANLVHNGIIDASNPATNIVWVLQGTSGTDLVRLFANPYTPFSLKRATRHFIFIDTPFLGSRLANIDELLPFSFGLSKVLSRPTRAEYTDDMSETARKFVDQVADIPLSLTCLSGEESMQRFTYTYSMSLILFILHYCLSIGIALLGTLIVVVGKQGFKLSYFDSKTKIVLWVVLLVVFLEPISSPVSTTTEWLGFSRVSVNYVHPFWRYVQFLNRPVVRELSAKHLCTLRKGSKADSLPLDYYTMSRPTSPSDDLMMRIRTAVEMNIKKNADLQTTEYQMKLKAIDNALFQMWPHQPVIPVMHYGNRELPQP